MEKVGEFFFATFMRELAEMVYKMTQCQKRLLDIDAAAEYLSLSEDTVRDLVAQGRLVAFRGTRKVQFDIRDLDKFVDEGKRAI